MNCDDIAEILDGRGIAALSPFDRMDFDAHVARCPDCAAQCLASECLLTFRVEVPALPPALVERALELHEIRAAAARERRSRRPVIVGSLMAFGAIAAMLAGVPWREANASNRCAGEWV
jgi:hypothetical protein